MEQHLSGPWHGELDTGFVKVRLTFRLDIERQLAHLRTREFGEIALPLAAASDRIVFAAPQVDIALDLAHEPALDGLTGVCRHGPARFPVRFLRHAPERTAHHVRAQTPQPPFPYDVEEIGFNGADGAPQEGTLTRPSGRTRGAVIFSNWYGRTGRDQTTAGHKPFAIWADELTRRGFPALR